MKLTAPRVARSRQLCLGALGAPPWLYDRMKFTTPILLWCAIGCGRHETQKADSSVGATNTNTKSISTLPIRWPNDKDRYQPGRLDSLRAMTPKCSQAPAVITNDSIGSLRPSLTLTEVSAICPTAAALWDWGDEGIPEPALFVRVGESLIELTLEDTLPNSRVTQVRTQDSTLRTSAGFGVGSRFVELAKVLGAPHLEEGECVLYVNFDLAVGLSFRLDMPNAEDLCEKIPGIARRNEWSKLPLGTRISEVVLYRPAAGA